MAATPLRIAVLDDHQMVRRGIVELINGWPHGQVVLEAEHGLDYEKQVADVGHIHVAIVDLSMPIRDGYDTMLWIARHHPRTRTLGLSYEPTDAAVHKALRCGACGVLPKTVQRAELHSAILKAHTEGFYYNALVDRQLRGRVEHELATRHPDALWESLSPMQRRVAVAYAKSKSGSRLDIAEQLGVQLSTINSHIKEVFTKLNVHGRLELAEMIWKYGWK